MSQPGWGVWLEPALPVPRIVDVAARAEALGASHLLLGEEPAGRDPYVALAAVAMATRSLVLVAGVAQPAARHPRTTAAALASLADLAPGRIVVGLGIGGPGGRDPQPLEAPRPYAALRGAVDDLEPEQQANGHHDRAAAAGRLGWSSSRSLPLLLPAGGPRLARLAARLADWALVAGGALDDVLALSAELRRESNGTPRPALAWAASLAWDPFRGGASAPAVDVAGDREDVVARLAAVREAVRPDLFVLPVRTLARPAAFVEDAAPAPGRGRLRRRRGRSARQRRRDRVVGDRAHLIGCISNPN